ncbi:MAG: transcriptional regulator CynR [Candidatus Thiodiazotropha endolucinida]
MDRNIMCPRSLRYLLAVAEHHSFTRAAETLFVSQPTLSQQIKQLEESLETQLLDRTGRTVHLTDAGEVYISYARRALGELDAGKRAIQELQDLSRGSLSLGMTPITDYLAAPLIDRFNKRYPGISVGTYEMPQDDIESGVLAGNIDIGIAFTNTLTVAANYEYIETQHLFIEPLNLAVGSTHQYAGQETPLDQHTLEREPLALLNSDFALRRHIDLYCLEHDIKPSIAIETNSLSTIIEVLRLGRLSTILPNTIACQQNEIFPVMLIPELPHHTITLISRKDSYKSPASLAFKGLATEWGVEGCHDTPVKRTGPCPMSEVCTPNSHN